LNIKTTNFEPYCQRDVTDLVNRGDCVFECVTNYADCNQDPLDGCEALISGDSTCSSHCIECLTLSGIDRTITPTCIVDPATPGDYKCNFTCPGTITTQVNCADADGKWETGCEVATNQDRDDEGVFMNEGVFMDCSIMEAEAVKNPWMFRHHLHIDLTKPVPTNLGATKNLPAGSIFCNNNMADPTLTGGLNGKCFFMCIDGFENVDRNAYNGCEDVNQTGGIYGYYTNVAQQLIIYGGYWIGDPHVEKYLKFLTDASVDPAFNLFITFPYNVDQFNYRNSQYWNDVPLWY